MELHKIFNLHKASNYRFVTRKWNIVNAQSIGHYDVGNKIIYNREIVKSNHHHNT